jgi:hypothetical protein
MLSTSDRLLAMLMNLDVNAHARRIGSVAELRLELARFASQQLGKSG